MFKLVDGFLLNAAQRLCDATLRKTGVTKFTLQQAAFAWSAVFMWIFFVIHDRIETAFFAMLVYMLVGVNEVIQTKEEKTYFDRYHRPILPTEDHVFLRFVALLLSVAVGVSSLFLSSETNPAWLLTCACACFIVWVYILACTPRLANAPGP